MNEIEINNILSKGANLLDITPSMFEEATSHYKAVYTKGYSFPHHVLPVARTVVV